MVQSKIVPSLYNETIKNVDWDKFTICDCTLREGEQAANVNLNLAEKMEVVHKLVEVGIDQVQGGYPGRSEIDKEFIKQCKRENLPIKVEALVQIFTPDWKSQIDAALESGADILGLMHPSSDIRLDYQKMTKQDMIDRCVAALRYGRGKLPVTRFSTTDSTRTEMSFLKEVYSAAIENGAERLLLADTAGSTTPMGIYTMVKEIVDTFKVPVEIHCHNDFGLATANTIAGICAGATIADVSVNGLGERAGNTPMAELLSCLKFLYNADIHYKVELMYDLSKLLERLTAVPIPGEKPLVGEYAFAHKLDAHVRGMYYNSSLYETINPELVGNRRVIPIGKYSGPFIIGQKLRELGIVEEDETRIKKIVKEVETFSIEKRRALTNDEIIGIYNKVKG